MMNELLKVARGAIESKLLGKEFKIPESVKKRFAKKQASFVTLTLNGGLRGCVGSLVPVRKLYEDVRENAINAAFYDPRFLPLSKKELPLIKIEVSVLSDLKKLDFSTPRELLEKLDRSMGVVLKKGGYSATFLPQVWDEIPDKVKFLEHLCRKAGLEKDEWKDSEIYYYTVEKVKDN